ncbi:MAG: ABC transporter permease [Alphaproteobacteria bacterium]|nr:ABC transporter permease [Alphaproteobacteria bacterium]
MVTTILVEEEPDAPPRRWSLRETVGRHPTVAIGLVILLLLAAMAIAAPYLWTVDPLRISPAFRLRGPSERFWFGTDHVGRDVYSRIVYGSRISLQVGLAVAVIATAIGLVVGLVSGYVRWLDGFVMRIMDGLMSIPGILLAIALMALTRPSLETVIIAIVIPEVPRVVRLVRAVVLTLREQPFVEAAEAVGTSFFNTLRRHILPNAVAPLIVQATYICASAMITEAILSFLGAGIPPEVPSWGNVMAEGRQYVLVAFHLIAVPGAFLTVTVLAVNLLGDGLRDGLDPRLRRRL